MHYKHVSQKPYCCVPACVQMILQRRKLPLSEQMDIAYDLGVILPPEDRHLLPKSHKGHRPKSGWGTRINIKRYSLAEFFKRRGYSLEETFQPARRFPSVKQFEKFLSSNTRKGNDLLICFNYPVLYRLEGSWGHASLVEKIKNNSAMLHDPGPKQNNIKKVTLDDLLDALKNHYRGGIWMIRKNPRR